MTQPSVYLVATGLTHEGQELYTRHDVCPALCDAEKLYPDSAYISDLEYEINRLQTLLQAAKSAGPAVETCELVGVKADGSEDVLGTIPVPSRMKMREFIGAYFGWGFNSEDSDASMALAAYDDLVAWEAEQKAASALQSGS